MYIDCVYEHRYSLVRIKLSKSTNETDAGVLVHNNNCVRKGIRIYIYTYILHRYTTN